MLKNTATDIDVDDEPKTLVFFKQHAPLSEKHKPQSVARKLQSV